MMKNETSIQFRAAFLQNSSKTKGGKRLKKTIKKMQGVLLCVMCMSMLVLGGCGGPEEPTSSTTPSGEQTKTPENSSTLDNVNPLTGLPIKAEYVNNRPIAVMLNNIKVALPQHGVSKADIIYEVLAEGGITRMLGVFQTVDGVGNIGTVRSTRTYYLDLAQGHDAILLHAGGSPDAYKQISSRGVTALDCVNGPYGNTLFWRDQARMKNAGYEHSVFTSGEKILELFPTYSFRQEHSSDYQYNMAFQEDGTPKNGTDAEEISIKFSNYKTGVFTYDADSGLYMISEYGKPYVDGETDEQVGVTNVLVLRTSISPISGDTAGRLDVKLTGSGEGTYACGGKIIDIVWSKASPNSQFIYTHKDGTPLVLGTGHTYVNIISTTTDVTIS